MSNNFIDIIYICCWNKTTKPLSDHDPRVRNGFDTNASWPLIQNNLQSYQTLFVFCHIVWIPDQDTATSFDPFFIKHKHIVYWATKLFIFHIAFLPSRKVYI